MRQLFLRCRQATCVSCSSVLALQTSHRDASLRAALRERGARGDDGVGQPIRRAEDTAAGLKKLEVMIMVPQDEVIAFADSAEKAKELLPILSRYHFVRSIAVGNEPDLPGGNPPQGKDLDIFQKLPIWQSLMCKLRCKAPRQALALWSRCPSPMVWWGQTMVTGVT